MRKLLLVVLAVSIAAVSAPQAGPRKKKAEPVTMGIETVQKPEAGAKGKSTELLVTLVPPKGIKLNRYPGITLTVTKAKGLDVSAEEVFVGDKEMKDPEKNEFMPVEPLVFSVVPKKTGKLYVEGSVKYFYCIKATGFCKPGKQTVKIPVSVD